jgi:hypothetical protein
MFISVTPFKGGVKGEPVLLNPASIASIEGSAESNVGAIIKMADGHAYATVETADDLLAAINGTDTTDQSPPR